MTTKTLATNAETVYLSAWIYPREFGIPAGLDKARAAPSFEDFANGRRRLKRPGWDWAGEILTDGPDGGERIRAPGLIHFEVSAGGTKSGFNYLLSNQDLTLKAVLIPSAASPAVYIELRAALVWAVGWRCAVEYARDLVAAMFGRIFKFELSRVDLTADFGGWDFRPGDVARFVGRPRRYRVHYGENKLIVKPKRRGSVESVEDVEIPPGIVYTRPKFTGCTIGPGADLQCRIYDKTEEIRTQSNKRWMFPIWSAAGWDGSSVVWRVEFQIRREILLQLGVGSWETFAERIQDAWRYLVEKWLRLAIPRSAGYRKFEWPTDPAWIVVQRSQFGAGWGLLTRKQRDEATPEILRKMIIGCATTLAAKQGVENSDVGLADFVASILLAGDVKVAEMFAAKLKTFQGGQVLRYNDTEETHAQHDDKLAKPERAE